MRAFTLTRVLSLALALAASASLCAAAFGGATLQIMPLGDSITGGYPINGGYREPLYYHLTGIGCDFKFLGTQTGYYTQTLVNAGQQHHEGHGGYTITQIDGNLDASDGSSGNNGGYWLTGTGARAAVYPDIILLDIGTNDLGSASAAIIAGRLDSLIGHIFTDRPNTALLVSNLALYNSSAADAYNALIPGVVDQYAEAGRKIYFVDMHSQLSAADISATDQTHPTASGYQKMGDTWFSALQSNGLVTPEPSSCAMISGAAGAFFLAAGWRRFGLLNFRLCRHRTKRARP